jgi:hypothetical protein
VQGASPHSQRWAKQTTILFDSVADPWNFDTDPNPRIYTSD